MLWSRLRKTATAYPYTMRKDQFMYQKLKSLEQLESLVRSFLTPIFEYNYLR